MLERCSGGFPLGIFAKRMSHLLCLIRYIYECSNFIRRGERVKLFGRNKKKLEEIYRLYENKMFYLAFSILRDEGQAEDVVHNSIIKLVDYLPKIKAGDSPECRALVMKVTKSTAIDLYRATRRVSSEAEVELIEDSQNDIDMHVNVVIDFPKEYKCVNNDKFLWSNNEGKDVSLVLLYAKELNEISVQNIAESKKINVGGHTGFYYDLQVIGDYDKQAIIFFEEFGYAVQMYGTSYISEEELIELSSGISLEEVTWDEADDAAFIVAQTQICQSQTVETVPGDESEMNELFEMNMQTVDFEDVPVMVNVIGAQVVNSIYELEGGYLFGPAQDCNECKYINADGTLADYTRSIIKRGDGVNSLSKVILQDMEFVTSGKYSSEKHCVYIGFRLNESVK